MDIIDNIGKKASDTCKNAAKQTGKLVEITKLKVGISKNKDAINDIYTEIGRKAYEEYTKTQEIGELFKQDCFEIDNLAKQIEDSRMKILELNGSKQCKNCFAEVEKEFEFCPKCGNKFENDDVKFCECEVCDCVKKEKEE